MTTEPDRHQTVMRDEAVNALSIHPTSIVVDATTGGGGHTDAIRARLGERGTLIAFDADREALARVRSRLAASAEASKVSGTHAPTIHFVESNFRNLRKELAKLGVHEVNAILADLGWSSEQFEGSGKGFSFKEEHRDEPLLMTFGSPETYLFTAADILADWSEGDIANVLFGYGEERYARRIAHAIADARVRTPIKTVGQLSDLIKGAVPAGYRTGRIHPATKTFQALRIAVNDELKALEEFIAESVAVLAAKGRLAIITFHSLEDRIVKHAFKDLAGQEIGTIITKKPLLPTREETTRNPRARSAKLRIFEKS